MPFLARLKLFVAILAAAGLLAACVTPAHAAPPQAHAVSLTDASVPPDYLRLLRADRSILVHARCRLTEVSAYRWDGTALGAQRWDGRALAYAWRDTREGGRVLFDGIAFHNHTVRDVLVAGWCS